MTTDFASVLAKKPDVVCICTQSNLRRDHRPGRAVGPGRLQRHLHRRAPRVSVGERPGSGPSASTRSPRSTASRILGTGINPGFVLDALSSCERRSACASTASRPARQRPLAVRPDRHGKPGRGHHRRGVRGRRRRRHDRRPHRLPGVDRPHRRALGWEIDEIVETREPIVTTVERSTPHVHVAPGDVCGCRHIGNGLQQGRAQDRAHPPAADPSRDGGRGHRRLHQDHRRPEREHGRTRRRSRAARARTRPPATTSRSSAPRRAGIVTVVDLPLPRFWAPTEYRGDTTCGHGHAAAPGDWVEVERVLLEPADRSANLPRRPPRQPLVVWVKGFARSAARDRRGADGRDDDRTVTSPGGSPTSTPATSTRSARPMPELAHVGADLRARVAAYRKAGE